MPQFTTVCQIWLELIRLPVRHNGIVRHCYNRVMNDYPLVERKLIYRALHGQLTEMTELMDSEFLHDLQMSLQQQAQAEGVDVADHGAWDAWLGNEAVSCAVRVAQRKVLN